MQKPDVAATGLLRALDAAPVFAREIDSQVDFGVDFGVEFGFVPICVEARAAAGHYVFA